MKKAFLIIVIISFGVIGFFLFQNIDFFNFSCVKENQTYDERSWQICCKGLVGVPNPNGYERECEVDLSSQGIEY